MDEPARLLRLRRPAALSRPRRARPASLAVTLIAVVALGLAACGSTQPSPSPAAASVSASASPSSAPSALDTASTSPSASTDPSASASPDASASPSATPLPPLDAQSGYATLDGVPVADALGHRLPVAVTIDDNVEARPQYGFNEASIVYQAPADGGEDRYMMVFQEQDAARVEPIRSGRPYFVNWALEYRAAFAHYGGDVKTLAYLPTLGGLLSNIDALNGSGQIFHRDGSRVAPHNAYGATAAIRALAVSRGAPALLPPTQGNRLFGPDLPAASRPAHASITVPYNRGTTGYTYDTASNSYLRSVAGRPQVDALNGQRVTARNVVVLFMALSIDPQSEPGYARPVLAMIGSGRAIVFHDGHAYEGTWRKPTLSDTTRFFDANGQEIPLVRGRIFIQVVPTGTKVTYTTH